MRTWKLQLEVMMSEASFKKQRIVRVSLSEADHLLLRLLAAKRNKTVEVQAQQLLELAIHGRLTVGVQLVGSKVLGEPEDEEALSVRERNWHNYVVFNGGDNHELPVEVKSEPLPPPADVIADEPPPY